MLLKIQYTAKDSVQAFIISCMLVSCRSMCRLVDAKSSNRLKLTHFLSNFSNAGYIFILKLKNTVFNATLLMKCRRCCYNFPGRGMSGLRLEVKDSRDLPWTIAANTRAVVPRQPPANTQRMLHPRLCPDKRLSSVLH